MPKAGLQPVKPALMTRTGGTHSRAAGRRNITLKHSKAKCIRRGLLLA